MCLECGGYPEALTQAISCLRKGGKVIMVGLQKPQVCNLEDMLWNEKGIISSFSANYQECDMGITLAKNGRLQLKPLVTHRFALKDIHRAFELLENRKEHIIKVVIVP